MKTNLLLLLPYCLSLAACQELEGEPPTPFSENWGPNTYQVDVVHENEATYFYAQFDDDGRLYHSFLPASAEEFPIRFYDQYFQNYREIIISSPYPIRPNWFRVACPDCVDPGDTASGIEFAVSTAREKDYLLIARLDSSYWECLRGYSTFEKTPGSGFGFSFQLLHDQPIAPTRFSLQGFYNQEQKLVHLKARRDVAGIWYPTTDYQVFQEPGPKDFSIHLSKHPQIGPEQSLLRIGSTMQLVPHSVWIGLPGECLDQADWEVHRNRNANRFLLDVVVPDCYLDCLNNVAEGFEFEVDFFQYAP